MGINRSYISEIDQFLEEFDKQHPQRSRSQQQAEKKAERIIKLRDKAVDKPNNDRLWEKF